MTGPHLASDWRPDTLGPLACEAIDLPEASVFLAIPGPTLAPALSGLLSDEEQARASRFRRDEDRLAYATAHALKRLALGRALATAPGALDFMSDENGKPRLRNGALHFNLSHSHSLVAVALSRTVPVGVDVEGDRDALLDPMLQKAAFATAELAQLDELAPVARAEALLSLWTLREAFAKATGDGIGGPPEDFRFELAALRIHHASDRWGPSEDWRFHLWRPRPGLSLALALAPRLHSSGG